MPLHGLTLHITPTPTNLKSDPRMICNANSLKELAKCLGATIVSVRDKPDLIVVTGQERAGMTPALRKLLPKGAPCVEPHWLSVCTERFSKVPTKEHTL